MRRTAPIFTIDRMPPTPPIPSTIRSSRRPLAVADLDDALAAFEPLRPRLLGIAHRILGSRAEAEDVVQDAWLRWQTYDRSAVQSPTAFLVTTTTRLAINAAQSARVRRESAVDRWSPEPTATTADPTSGPERTEALRDGIALLERLAPSERAAYVLRQAFGYPYPEIARVLRTSAVNARQLVSRAGKRLATRRPQPATTAATEGLTRAFVDAARLGEVAALERLFAAEAASPRAIALATAS